MSLFKHDKVYYAINQIKRAEISYDYSLDSGIEHQLRTNWLIKQYEEGRDFAINNWFEPERTWYDRKTGKTVKFSEHNHDRELCYSFEKEYPVYMDVKTKILVITNITTTLCMQNNREFNFNLLKEFNVVEECQQQTDYTTKRENVDMIINLTDDTIKIHDQTIDHPARKTMLGYNFENNKKLVKPSEAIYGHNKFHILLEEDLETNAIVENFVENYAHYYFDEFISKITS